MVTTPIKTKLKWKGIRLVLTVGRIGLCRKLKQLEMLPCCSTLYIYIFYGPCLRSIYHYYYASHSRQIGWGFIFIYFSWFAVHSKTIMSLFPHQWLVKSVHPWIWENRAQRFFAFIPSESPEFVRPYSKSVRTYIFDNIYRLLDGRNVCDMITKTSDPPFNRPPPPESD